MIIITLLKYIQIQYILYIYNIYCMYTYIHTYIYMYVKIEEIMIFYFTYKIY